MVVPAGKIHPLRQGLGGLAHGSQERMKPAAAKQHQVPGCCHLETGFPNTGRLPTKSHLFTSGKRLCQGASWETPRGQAVSLLCPELTQGQAAAMSPCSRASQGSNAKDVIKGQEGEGTLPTPRPQSRPVHPMEARQLGKLAGPAHVSESPHQGRTPGWVQSQGRPVGRLGTGGRARSPKGLPSHLWLWGQEEELTGRSPCLCSLGLRSRDNLATHTELACA